MREQGGAEKRGPGQYRLSLGGVLLLPWIGLTEPVSGG